MNLSELDVPLLPPGHFYRVGSEAFGMMSMEIRKKNKRFGSHCVSSIKFFPSDHDDGKTVVTVAAHKVLKEWEADVRRRKIYKDAASFVGDHNVSCTSH